MHVLESKIINTSLKTVCAFGLSFCFSLCSKGQTAKAKSSVEIYEAIQRLNFLGSAMYLAAHPDDENTALISWFSNQTKARTAYLSITRGDGGQNLIGTEQSEILGVLRTEELLAARKIDGGEQLFTRAKDFGFSKMPDETLKVWDRNAVLADVVWNIRKFRPDIIVNRFDHRTPGTTHGHHTASAMLSFEAFDLAASPQAFPDQLALQGTWQPKRLFFNTTHWFYQNQEDFEAEKPTFFQANTGEFYPLRGRSNTEISAESRSKHLSQGFGTIGQRGEQSDYLELLKGSSLGKSKSLFEGINTTWSRVEGGELVGKILNGIESNFNFKSPEKHVPELIEAYTKLQEIKDEHWKHIKSKALKAIILNCLGLYLEARSTSETMSPNTATQVSIEAVNRSQIPVKLVSVTLPDAQKTDLNIDLKNNALLSRTFTINVPDKEGYTVPYWLLSGSDKGMYSVKDLSLIGLPSTPPKVVTFELDFGRQTITFDRPLIYKYANPSKGEVRYPVVVVPEVSVSFVNPINLFRNNQSKQITLKLKSNRDNVHGEVSLNVPFDWKLEPKSKAFDMPEKNREALITFTLTPPEKESEGYAKPIVKVGDNVFEEELLSIEYDHIPKQFVLIPSQARVVKMDLKTTAKNVGYIEGTGDKIVESLIEMGCDVVVINPRTMTLKSLQQFETIVLGIRAYNVSEALRANQNTLLEYVKSGGTLVTQYNTSMDMSKYVPYPLSISRDRVVEEDAEVGFEAPEHPVLNTPNQITVKDFEGWIQERGLYFPNSWDAKYNAILSMHDTGESPKKGSLLVASFGKGYYVYTGLSFFRELPAGVQGAYRLFANIISLSTAKKKP